MNNCCSLLTNETPRHSIKDILKREFLISFFSFFQLDPWRKHCGIFFICVQCSWLTVCCQENHKMITGRDKGLFNHKNVSLHVQRMLRFTFITHNNIRIKGISTKKVLPFGLSSELALIYAKEVTKDLQDMIGHNFIQLHSRVNIYCMC